MALAAPLWSQEAPKDLTEISLDSLLDMQVTIAGKQAEKVAETAAAVYVVTRDDIDRFGFTSVPEALRMVPGLDVARVSGGIWAITSRGFNARYADKLLVLVDGRSIYSPTFSGVDWSVQDVPIEEIDRIEVIRGPGAALWGTNAVNGVINIITKPAKSTKGGLLVAGSGSEEHGFSSFRWGGDFAKSGAYRFAGKFFDRAPLEDATTGGSSVDKSHFGSANFRSDWGSGRDQFMISGSLYRGFFGSTAIEAGPLIPLNTFYNDAAINSGGNVLGLWTRDYSKTSGLSLQFYLQEEDRKDLQLNEHNLTADLDFQYRFSLGSRNKVIWGTAYRENVDHFENGIKVSMTPDRERIHTASVFAQDEVSLPDHIRLTLGARAEQHSDEANNFQPDLRALWAPSAKHSTWVSASRAFNKVSRIQSDAHILLAMIPTSSSSDAVLTLDGASNVKEPQVTGFESGYRYKPTTKFYVDLAAFYNVYHRLYTQEPGVPILNTSGSVPYIQIPLTFANGMGGRTYGTETTLSFAATRRWKINGLYSFLRMQLHLSPGSHDTTSVAAEGQSPRNQFQLRSSYDLVRNIHADSALYFTGGLPGFGIGSYSRLDLALGWHLSETTALSFVVQNALSAAHREFIDTTGSQSTLVRRSAYMKWQWHF